METSEENLDKTWRLLGQPSGNDHHRYFERISDGRVSICDNSGRNPDFTEDGPLLIDRNRKAKIIKCTSAATVVSLPVLNKDKEDCRCMITAKDAIWLLDRGLWDIKDFRLEIELEPQAELLARYQRQHG